MMDVSSNMISEMDLRLPYDIINYICDMHNDLWFRDHECAMQSSLERIVARKWVRYRNDQACSNCYVFGTTMCWLRHDGLTKYPMTFAEYVDVAVHRYELFGRVRREDVDEQRTLARRKARRMKLARRKMVI
jgi:hypothetical protein